jgi:hypothetical protein
MTQDPVGREGNRGKRILDFMGHAARYFPPGGLFLSTQQVREVLKYQYVTHALMVVLQSCDRDGDV